MNQKNVEFIARMKLRFFIGWTIISVPAWILNLETFAKVWSPTFEYYGISSTLVYLGIPAVFVVSCYYIGHFWDMWGIWNRENDYTNRANNPQIPEMMNDIKEIRRMLERKGGT